MLFGELLLGTLLWKNNCLGHDSSDIIILKLCSFNEGEGEGS